MNVPAGVWGHGGFSSSPYSTSALLVDSDDEGLPIGHDENARAVLQGSKSRTQMVAAGGNYGVGTSSLPAASAAIAPGHRDEHDTVMALEKRLDHQGTTGRRDRAVAACGLEIVKS